MRKYSKEATLHKLLQGMWKGIQVAKNDPLVQAKYPRGLGFIEKFVTDLGKKAKRDPNFRLTERQVKKLNQFLGGSSGVLSSVLRRHIVKYCSGDHCTMVSPNDFRFEYKPKTYHITGHYLSRDIDGDEDRGKVDKVVEKLSEVLDDYKAFFDPIGNSTEYKLKNGAMVMTSRYTNPRDVFDYYETYSELKLFVNGKPLSKSLAAQAISYLSRD